MSFAHNTPGLIPIAGAECAFHSNSRVAAPIRDVANRVLLLEREPCRQRAEPAAGTTEGFAALLHWIVRQRVAREFERVPGDRAEGPIDEVAESRQPVLAHKAVWVFGIPEPPRLDDAKRRSMRTAVPATRIAPHPEGIIENSPTFQRWVISGGEQ